MDDTKQIVTSNEEGVEAVNRRQALKGLVFGAAGIAAASSLVGCLGDGKPSSSAVIDPTLDNNIGTADGSSTAIGSFGNPYTQDNFGDYSTGLSSRNPKIFGAAVSDPNHTKTVVRLWVEVMGDIRKNGAGDPDSTTFDVLADESARICADGVTEIRIVDQDTMEILASRSLESDFHPRFITYLNLGTRKKVAAYAYIPTKGGWWRGSEYTVSSLTVRNSSTGTDYMGFFRLPLTRFNPGFLDAVNATYPDDLNKFKDYKHQGFWQTFGRRKFRWVLADFDETGAPQSHTDWNEDGPNPNHIFKGGYVLDQNDQLIDGASYQWGDSGATLTTTGGVIAQAPAGITTTALNLGATTKDVPYLTFTSIPDGVTSLRVIWLCNLDGWWESRVCHIG